MAYHELTITASGPLRDALIRHLGQAGCLGMIEKKEAIIAYFPETADIDAIGRGLSILKTLLEKAGTTGGELTFTQALIPDQDWNETWKKGFLPIDVGDFTILPPWEKTRRDRINLIIDPVMAFGTGHHETTRSCLVLMGKYAASSGHDSFLDVGTGTGILAIAAAKMGYRSVVGIDTDKLAVEAAKKNIEINHVPYVDIREGEIPGINGRFDCITANIISGVLVQLAPQIASHLKADGTAILSGILLGQDDEVALSMEKAGLKLLERYIDGKWRSLVVRPAR